ncbi:cytochrome P450 [Physcia stellaris]|nr:cytochrome P450 [Physcia stellaris]
MIEANVIKRLTRAPFSSIAMLLFSSMLASPYIVVRNFRGRSFKLGEAHGECVILPTSFMEELKALPDDLLNLDDEIDEEEGLEQWSPVKNELTRSLDSTEVDIQNILVRVIALVSGRVIVRLPRSRNQEYVDCIILFTSNVWYCVPDIRWYPESLRKLTKYTCPKVRKVHPSLNTMERLLRPMNEESRKHLDSDEATAPQNICLSNLKNNQQQGAQEPGDPSPDAT